MLQKIGTSILKTVFCIYSYICIKLLYEIDVLFILRMSVSEEWLLSGRVLDSGDRGMSWSLEPEVWAGVWSQRYELASGARGPSWSLEPEVELESGARGRAGVWSQMSELEFRARCPSWSLEPGIKFWSQRSEPECSQRSNPESQDSIS
jgi:hypothetical protein